MSEIANTTLGLPDWEALARSRGERAVLLPVSRLADIQAVIRQVASENELNSFQSWIINDLYSLAPPETVPAVQSVLLWAMTKPFYANVRFALNGKEYTLQSFVCADHSGMEAFARQEAERCGFHVWTAGALPLKRLAVHSGLAKYGRNNITYVEAMGGNVGYQAFFTDCPCENDPWTTDVNAPECNGCERCIKACPTGAILPERFLIDNLRCLSCMNESPGAFPDWLPRNVHHMLYDCNRCQQACPMNREQLDLVEEGVSFDEAETRMLLDGAPLDDFSEDARRRLAHLGMAGWYDVMARNLRILMENEDDVS